MFSSVFNVRYLTRLSTLRTKCPCIKLARNLHDEFANDPLKPVKNQIHDKPQTTTPAVASRFNVFTDDKATIILDVEEERDRISEDVEQVDDLLAEVYAGLNLESKISNYLVNRLSKFLMTITFRRCKWCV